MTDTGPTDLDLESALSAYADALGSTIAAAPIAPADPGADAAAGDHRDVGSTGPAYGSAPSASSARGSSPSSRMVVAAAVLVFCVITVALVVGHGRLSPSSGQRLPHILLKAHRSVFTSVCVPLVKPA